MIVERLYRYTVPGEKHERWLHVRLYPAYYRTYESSLLRQGKFYRRDSSNAAA